MCVLVLLAVCVRLAALSRQIIRSGGRSDERTRTRRRVSLFFGSRPLSLDCGTFYCIPLYSCYQHSSCSLRKLTMIDTESNVVEEEASFYFREAEMENAKPPERRRLKLSLEFLKANPLAFRRDSLSESSTLPSPFAALIRPPSLESSSLSSTSSETVGSSSHTSSSSSPPRVVVVPNNKRSSPMSSSASRRCSIPKPEPSAPKHDTSIRRFWDEGEQDEQEQRKQQQQQYQIRNQQEEESSGDDCPSCCTEDSLDYSIPSLLDEEEEMFFSKMNQQEPQERDRAKQPVDTSNQRIVFVRGPDGYTKAVVVPATAGSSLLSTPRIHDDTIRFGAIPEEEEEKNGDDSKKEDCSCFLKLPPGLVSVLSNLFGKTNKTPLILSDRDSYVNTQGLRTNRHMQNAATNSGQRQQAYQHRGSHRYQRQTLPQRQHTTYPIVQTTTSGGGPPQFFQHPHHRSGNSPTAFHHGSHQIPAFVFGRPPYYATHPGYR